MPAEIDTSNSAAVADLLSGLTAQGGDTITCDLTGTTFCDSAGVYVLARAHEHAAASGIDLRLAAGDSPVGCILQLTGLDQAITVHPSVQRSLESPLSRRGTAAARAASPA